MVPRSSRLAALARRRGAVLLFLIALLLLAGVAALAVSLGGGSSRSELQIYDPGARTPIAVGSSDVALDSVGVSDTAAGWQLHFQLTQRGAARMQAVSATLSRAAQAGHTRAARLAYAGRVYEQARVIFQPAPPGVKAAAVIQVGGLTCPATQRLASRIGGGRVANRVPCVVRSPAGRLPRQPAKAIAAGSSYTCALTRSGGAECWGDNRFGQLGDGTISGPHQATPQPVAVHGLRRGIRSISGGAQASCALLASGRVECWGLGLNGQLGAARQHTVRPMPVPIAGVKGARAIVVADTHACALVRTGVDCWGLDGQGQLGDGAVANAPRLARVKGLGPEIQALAAGGIHTCAITERGRVFCWGFNGSGQLGDGTRHERIHPVAVRGLSGRVVEVAAGGLHTCALTATGVVECWGSNASGEIGGGGKASLKPRPVKGLPKAQAIAVGESTSCAVTTAGGVECWGSNVASRVGRGSRAPVKIGGIGGRVISLALGPTHMCALLGDGSVKCWGQNDQGQLGDGRAGSDRPRPARVLGLGR
jgi:alpha-tubulin suppressor-like RCC1 family protein